MRLAAAAFFFFLLPGLAAAQSREKLQATALAAAQKYGVPVNVLDQLIQGESAWNPNVGCNSFGACGVAQFIPGTAAQYGVDVNDPTSSINGAAHYLSDLQAKSGSWVQALSSYSGGCNPQNPCNAAYAQAFQNAQVADNGGTTFSDGSSLSAGPSPAAPPVPASASILFRPFQWTWDHVMVQAQNNIGNTMGSVQSIAWQPIAPILVLSAFAMAINFWSGKADVGSALPWLVTVGIAASLIWPGNPWYQEWVNFVQGVPSYFASNIGGLPNSGPAGVFDSVWQAVLIKIDNTWHTAPWEKVLLTGLLLALVVTDVLFCLSSIFFTFLVANFILYILLVVGAVFLLGLLFKGTHGFFRFWLDLVVAGIAYILILDVVLTFFTTVMTQLIDAVGSATTPWTDMLPNLLGAAIVFAVLAGVNAFLALQVGRIHGAGSSAMAEGWSRVGATAGTAMRLVRA